MNQPFFKFSLVINRITYLVHFTIFPELRGDLTFCISRLPLISSISTLLFKDVSDFDHSAVNPPVSRVTSDSSGYNLAPLTKPRTLALSM